MNYSLFVFIGLQPEKLRKKSIGRPKKGRKSVNFTVPSKGAQSSKAMRRSQSSYAKINKTLLKEGTDSLFSERFFTLTTQSPTKGAN